MTVDEYLESQKKKPVRRTVGHPEEDLQRECVAWFRESYPDIAPLLFHPNNEPFFGGWGKTEEQKRRRGQRAKNMGVTPGVADLILLFPSGPYHGLCIEMKTKTGTQKETQKSWQKIVEAHGYLYVVIRCKEAFKDLIRKYVMQEPLDPDVAAVRRIFGKDVKIHGK